MARERGVLTLVDGAQSFGLLDVNLARHRSRTSTPAARTSGRAARASAACSTSTARRTTKLWPSIYSAYPGAVGFSRTFEGFGQRDEATMIAFGEALEFQTKVGRTAIEAARPRAEHAADGRTGKLPGVTVWTSPVPELRAAVVSFQPGTLDASKLATALYEKHKIAVATRGGRIAAGCGSRRTSTTARTRSIGC